MNKVIHRNCPNCGQDNTPCAPTEFGNNDWQIKDCSMCGFVYLETAAVYECLIEEFAWEKTSVSERLRKYSKEPVKQAVSKILKTFRRRWLKRDKLGDLTHSYIQPGNILDVGCAAGGFLSNLNAIYVPHGIEISKVLAARANKEISSRGGYVIHDNALSGLSKFPSGYFTGILMSAFLEHEINPKALLAEAYRSLNEGGYCIIKVPNFASLNRIIRGKRWCGFRLPDHVNYFTPTNLSNMCQSVGFGIEKFSIVDHLPTSDNMWIVIQKPYGHAGD